MRLYPIPGLILAAVMLLTGVSAGQAQEADPPGTPATAVAEFSDPQPLSLPRSVRLEGLRPVYQQINRCSAAALTIQLSYFEWDGTYDEVIRALNPYAEDMAVRLDEMITYAETQGLRAVARYGGTNDLLKRLVAAGFPVLVENSYFDSGDHWRDWMGHNRVVMGYDDDLEVFYTFDSLLGNGEDGRGRPIPYADMDSRWRVFNRDYLVLYRPDEEAAVQAALGPQWDETYNHEWALSLSQREIDEGIADGFTYFNLGSSLLELERPDEAVAAYDQALSMQLPWRMLWYQYGPFEAYLHAERYDEVISLAAGVIGATGGIEESYYYMGLAYEAQNDLRRAESMLRAATIRNGFFAPAAEALERVRAAMETTTGG